MANDITFEEYLALSRITFEWADSYDSKDFSRLEAILAPQVTLDYSEAFGQKPITMSKSAFMALSNNENRLGGIVDCVHHIGGSKYDRTGPESVTGSHQVIPYSLFFSCCLLSEMGKVLLPWDGLMRGSIADF